MATADKIKHAIENKRKAFAGNTAGIPNQVTACDGAQNSLCNYEILLFSHNEIFTNNYGDVMLCMLAL